MNIVKFRAAHLAALELQDAQSYFSSQIKAPGYAAMLESAGQAFTAMDGGTVVGCGGITEIWDGRAVLWSLLSKSAARHMTAIHRATRGFVLAQDYSRIEAWVDEGFEPGMRWARLLGFACETPEPMRNFRPGGGSCFLFSRIK